MSTRNVKQIEFYMTIFLCEGKAQVESIQTLMDSIRVA